MPKFLLYTVMSNFLTEPCLIKTIAVSQFRSLAYYARLVRRHMSPPKTIELFLSPFPYRHSRTQLTEVDCSNLY